MCRVIAVRTTKGGTGKTTTCINLGIGLVRAGYKVLLIDNDPQGSMSLGLGLRKIRDLQVSLATLLTKVVNQQELQWHEGIMMHQEGVEFIPANSSLADMEFISVRAENSAMILREYVDSIREDYDYILIDCSPSLSSLTLNALCAADSILIPMEAEYLSAMGVEEQLQEYFKMKRNLNRGLEVEGILITKMNERALSYQEIVELITDAYGAHFRVFPSRIPRTVRIPECSAEGISIYKYAPRSKAAEAYRLLAEEVSRS